MNIKMISPRTIFHRKPFGKNILEVKNASKVNYKQSKDTAESNEIEFWIVEPVLNQQLELYIKGCDAVLHNFTSQDNSHLFTGFTETPIKCAVFTCLSDKVSTNATIDSIFQDLNNSYSKGVVLFTDTIAKYYGFNAEMHTCKLPCQVSGAWRIRNCLFVEREETETEFSDEISPHSLFLMSHTLAEFTPVVFRDEFGYCGFINDTRFRIVSVCEASFLLLAYDTFDESFSLWRIRDAVQQDFADLYDVHWDGSIAVKKEKLLHWWNNNDNSVSFRSSRAVAGGSIGGGAGEYSISMNHHQHHHHQMNRSHVSSEYFEITAHELTASTTTVAVINAAAAHERTVDDLDIRSPMARSLKITKDAQIPDKMTLLQEINKINQIYRQMVEPLYPKVCLDFLFQCKSSIPESLFDSKHVGHHSTPMGNDNRKMKNVKTENATKGFFVEDFYRRKYLCCLNKYGKENMLTIVKFNYENNCFSHLDEHCWAVLDAVYLDGLKLIIILEIGSTLALYTGMTFVCKISLLNALIYEPNMFDESGREMSTNDINNMVSLSEPTNNGFTIQTQSNLSVRLYMPEMVRFHLVKKCLLVLKKLLPIDVGMVLLCRWYSLNRAVDNNEATSTEWRRFVDFLLENIGFVKNLHHSNLHSSILRDVKELCLNNIVPNKMEHDLLESSNDASMEEICTKKLRTNSGLYSLENKNINRDKLEDYSGLSHNVADRLLSRYATTVLFSLHLVYECEKINYSSCLYLDNLAALNCSLACSVEANQYVDYYVRDNPDLWSRVNQLPSLMKYVSPVDNEMIWNPQPPDWNKWFTDILLNRPCDRYPIIEDLSEMILHLIKIWLVMFRHEKLIENPEMELNNYLFRINFNLNGKPCQFPLHVCQDIVDSISKGILDIVDIFERVAAYLGQISFHTADLDYMNIGLATIFKLVFFHCNKYPHLYNILHRSDLDKQRQLIMPIIKENSVVEVMPNPLHKFRSLSEARRNCFSYWTNNVKPSINIKKFVDFNKNDNHYLLAVLDSDPMVQLSYSDLRIHEAYKMLQSCCPIELDANICSNFTVDDGDILSPALKDELDGHLKIINCQRTFSLAIGRGMLGLQTVQSNWLGEKLPVPQLCLTGKFRLSESGKPQIIESSASTKVWPNFHNGVAAGLMISPMNDGVDFVWILKQCPSMHLDKIELNPEQAGILFGLGLNGHLNKLSADTIGQTIKSMNEMATMAILIAMSAFNLGSKNSVLSKHISFHYRRLIPGEKDHTDPIPTLSQVSAIISAGLLNFKSGDRKMARIFIEEMGRSREHLSVEGTPPLDVELTSVTAGFSVGLIMFQQGDIVFGREYNPEELTRLMSYLKGTYRFQSKENVCADVPTDLQIRAILKNNDVKKPQPISEVDSWNSFQTKNPRVQEGEYYNMDITGSGAAVALGLIFMDSGNEIIARQLECPETFYLLEQIRSPVLCFRQIAHGLIMWRKIKSNSEWVDSTIPEFVASKALMVKPTEIQEKYFETVNDSYLQMLVGSCFVMGLRYAGTDNDCARQTIIIYVEKLMSIKTNAELMQNVNRNQYDWALSTLFLSACMISAGSGNLQLLQLSRHLRSIHHPKDCVNYGVYMTYSMSIGLLFLGGGKLTLSNSPRCAAILLIAFFPRFPPTYSGRRYHLQSLRHLYVIATRPRVMCAVDLDTQIAVPIESKIILRNETREYHGCFVYPPDNPALIEQIEFYDKAGKYWPQIYKPKTEPWNILLESLQSGGYFFVKKKSIDLEIKELVEEFRVEKSSIGYQLSDYRLFEQFVYETHDLDCKLMFDPFAIHDKVLEFVFNHISELKQYFLKIISTDIKDFPQLIMLMNWCNQSNLMKIWSVFSSYFGLSLHLIKEIQCGEEIGGDYSLCDEDTRFILRTILQ